MDYKKVMVPLDGSDNSELAFKRAMEFVTEPGTSLYLVHVIDTMPLVGNYGVISGDLFYDLSERAREYLTQMKEKAESQGAKNVSIHVRFGNPKTVISKDFVDEYHVDLIVIGSTGLNAVERILVGSVAEYVNRHAKVDVMIIKQ
ncbi:universal stress protein [Xylocopilactobacillus apicola]|uniref:Universal stress protein n=1 Tax=Xylocopilactobacillus apicola TaxID=2932184 RepID=A0AAU9DBD2_9LACO|nr:universal stress protein [Xylocopilactobacillus apicola]BDR58097.1 universal stress protein [Xylocopilactobacillus apicola]